MSQSFLAMLSHGLSAHPITQLLGIGLTASAAKVVWRPDLWGYLGATAWVVVLFLVIPLGDCFYLELLAEVRGW